MNLTKLLSCSQRRERREREVRRLREEISQKKTAIATVTKGIPFNKIEVRPTEQLPVPSYVPQPPTGAAAKTSTVSLPPPFPGTQVRLATETSLTST